MTTAPATAARQPDPIALGGALARGAVFVPLCLYGLLAWATLIEPDKRASAWAMTAFAALAALALQRAAALPDSRTQRAVPLLVVLGLAVAALLCAGVSADLLKPARWDELAAGIAEGLRSIPAVASPYRGGDPWVEATILLGGTLLAGIAALQAFWPSRLEADAASARHVRRAPELRSPVPAAITLTTMFGIAVIEVPPERAVLHGALFAALLAAFLFADRIGRSQMAPAATLIAIATLMAAALAPAIDSDGPWVDLQKLSEDVANTGTVAYDWDHSYGPLDWSRDGRELLRIKPDSSAYWKADVLDEFDGRTWRRTERLPSSEEDGEVNEQRPKWIQHIEVRVRGLRSEQFVLAGQALDVTSQKDAVRVGGGTYVTARGLLRRGMTYGAEVYTPSPTPAELARAGTDYPPYALAWLSVEIPGEDGAPQPGAPGERPMVTFSPFGADQADLVTQRPGWRAETDVAAALDGTGLERAFALAESLRASNPDPYRFVRAVQERVERDGIYTEQPAQSKAPLDTFLFETHRGYCQHFSGAMALLLRMGGIPARVAVGFAPGRLDRKTKEYVIRDYDAHSWVEAYFPRYGWITFDPTPAAAPPRDQVADRARGIAIRGVENESRGDIAEAGAAAPGGGGSGWLLPAAAGLLAVLLLSAALLLRRRRARRAPLVAPELAELERALRVSGRPAAPATTLTDLERQLGASTDARGYLRAVAAQRFAASGAPPTERQRRAMRHELASGLGRIGRLRAWWAMPPRPFAARSQAR
jgi:transglutaminase-like putative cysteine protease